MITSTHNPKIQLVRTLLGRSKDRRETGAFVAEGVRLVEEAMAAHWTFRFVLKSEVLNERGQALINKIEENRIEVEAVSDKLLSSISETETSQGILAVLDYSLLPLPQSLNFVLIPDQIRDPGNLGTLLRTADAAGVQVVMLPPETADAFSPKVVRAGMGAHFRLPIRSMSWEHIRAATCELKIHLADMEAEHAYWQVDFRSPLALIVGGEADGPSRSARELADSQVTIPMPGTTESLNAAVAGAILMFEVLRQRTGNEAILRG